jgi:hypothetical protein
LPRERIVRFAAIGHAAFAGPMFAGRPAIR